MKRSRSRRLAAGLFGCGLIALAGCSSILPQPAPPPVLYRLTAANDFPARRGSVPPSTQLAIAQPTAEAALDTTRIALTRSATTLDYFADSAWTDRLPLVLEARLLDSFENARITAVSGDQSYVDANAILTTALRRFEARYDGNGPPRWEVEISANLIALPERRIIATRRFSAEVPASANDMTAIITSADAAWRQVARDIVDWAATTLSRAPR